MIALPLCVAAAAFIVAVGLPSSDPDMWWHLASGRWIIEHGEPLRVEIFSSTAAGRPYVVGEWLGQVVLAAAHGAAGWTGLAVLRALLVAVAAFSLTRVALRAVRGGLGPTAEEREPRAPATAIAVGVVALALVLSKIAWTDRPQLFSIAAFPVLLDLLFMARAGQRRALFAVPALIFLWSDLHGGYTLGLVIAAIFAVDAAVARRQAGPFALAAIASVVVVLANPGAIGVLPATAHVATAPRNIVEEAPPDVLTPAGAVFALFAVGLLAALLLRGGPLLSALLLVPLLWLALSAQRHMVFFVFAAVPFLTDAAIDAWDRWGRASRGRARARRALAPGVAVLLWIAALASIPTAAPTAPDETPYPREALGALQASSGVLIHEYDWGGWLIWNAPTRPVFVDGRLLPFVPDILEDHLRATLLRPGWQRIIDHYSVAQALLDPDRPLAGALREEGWRVLREGNGFVLLERPR